MQKAIQGITVAHFYETYREKLRMELVTGEAGLHRLIREGSINRPALALTGFFKYFANKRIQVLGAAEMTYLKTRSPGDQVLTFRQIAKRSVPCLVLTRNFNPTKAMLAVAGKMKWPIFRTPLITMNFINLATLSIDNEFAPSVVEHATTLDIKGVGVLLRGNSGVGKSECALALIERGHSLVADDLTVIKLLDERELMASSRPLNRGYMECRGIGIINIAEMFGVKSVRIEKRIDLVVTLREWTPDVLEERTGLEEQHYEILGIEGASHRTFRPPRPRHGPPGRSGGPDRGAEAHRPRPGQGFQRSADRLHGRAAAGMPPPSRSSRSNARKRPPGTRMSTLDPRPDGRRSDQLRPVVFQADIAPHATGSVLVRFGATQVICAATIEPGVPTWMKQQGVKGGWLTAEYSLLPYATLERKARDISRGRLDGRTVEIQRLIGRALRAVIDLDKLGSNTLWIDCDVLQADGGTRTAAITGAYLAARLAVQKLIDARKIPENPLVDSVAAVSVGVVGGRELLDLDYVEDKDAEVDFNVVMTGQGRFVEVQGNGEETTFSGAQLQSLIALAQKGLQELASLQAEFLAHHLLKSAAP